MNRALLGIAAALLLARAGPALAHAFLDHAQPAVGSTLTTPPARVRIWFTEALEPAFSTIIVTDAQGRAMGVGKAKVDPADPQLLEVNLAPLQPGTYQVVWRVVSVDTHPTEGHFEFTVRP
jgi:copper resistance protein C